MKKYLLIFRMALSQMLEFRFDFWAGRFSSFIVLLTSYFLWTTVFSERQEVFGYTFEKMVTYALGVAFLFNTVVVSRQEAIGWDIVEGTMTSYLVRPMNYFFYYCAHIWAKRILYSLSSVLIVFLFIPFIHHFFIQYDPWILLFFLLAVVQGTVLYMFIDFIFGITAFWFYRSFGPRWMIEMVVILTSGLAFPIDLLPSWLYDPMRFTPFPYLVFFPMTVYLGRASTMDMIFGFIVGSMWIILLVFLRRWSWLSGLRRYEGAGI